MVPCCWPLNFFLEGKFDMSVWAFAFPLDALAAAAVTAYSYTKYDAMQVRHNIDPAGYLVYGTADGYTEYDIAVSPKTTSCG